MPLRVLRDRVIVPDERELSALRETYARQQCVTLHRFFEEEIIRRLQRRMSAAKWTELVHTKLDPPAVDLLLYDEVLYGTVVALLHDRALLAAIRAITGCDPIGSFRFRFYRMDGGAGHVDTWHSDNDGNRMVTLSVNIGDEPFEGGELEIRERATGGILHRVANTRRGDAVLFRIGPDLEHRVNEVRGSTPKLAIAGWFQREPILDLGRLVRS